MKRITELTMTEVLAALGYTHRKGTGMYAHDVFRGAEVVFHGNVFQTRAWLKRTGQWRALAEKLRGAA